MNYNLAAAVLSPGGMFILGKKRKKEFDINQFHIFLDHAHLGVLKATAQQQHEIRLVGNSASCSRCSQAKRIRAATPHHTTARARAPMDLIYTDTAGLCQELLGGSLYAIMFVYSASHLQRPGGTRDKSAPTILAVAERFVANMGVPGAFRTDNGPEYTNRTFTEHCDGLGIHRELTAPYTPQQNGAVESALARTRKAGLAARLEVNKIFPDVHLGRVNSVRDRVGAKLWLESVLWAAEALNRSATSDNAGVLSPYEAVNGE